MKYIDEMIQEAQKRGDFNNLKGEGQPLDLSENPYNKETRLAHSIVKQGGFTLGFIAERRELEVQIQQIREKLARGARTSGRGPFAALRWQKCEQQFRRSAAEINRRIRNYNLKAPPTAVSPHSSRYRPRNRSRSAAVTSPRFLEQDNRKNLCNLRNLWTFYRLSEAMQKNLQE